MEKLTRPQAQKAGLGRYFTGLVCPAGHIAQRYVSTMQCVDCVSAYTAKWKNEHPEATKAIKRNYRKRNPALAKEWKAASQKRNRASANVRQRRYVEANKEVVYARTGAWAKANPGKVCANTRRYQTDKLQRTPPWSDHYAIQGMYELAAVFRGIGLDVEVDHVIPLRGRTVSGLHVPDNLQLINATSNRSKSNHFQGA